MQIIKRILNKDTFYSVLVSGFESDALISEEFSKCMLASALTLFKDLQTSLWRKAIKAMIYHMTCLCTLLFG